LQPQIKMSDLNIIPVSGFFRVLGSLLSKRLLISNLCLTTDNSDLNRTQITENPLIFLSELPFFKVLSKVLTDKVIIFTLIKNIKIRINRDFRIQAFWMIFQDPLSSCVDEECNITVIPMKRKCLTSR
jgi:hypothetical protein